ncbi:kelch-like protein 23 [Erpetoichthys calabaricus]|nr:kelch-like protein 23 [Erpetoichthys calabaricus]
MAVISVKEQDFYTYNFSDVGHPAEFLDSFKEFYVKGLFTDISLQCSSGEIFHCHKAALSACSTYFKVMFTADMKERSNNVIKLSSIDREILTALVNYVYSSQVAITVKNVQSLLEAANLLQFLTVKNACEEFLVRHLDVDNCLGMHSFAEFHICPILEKEARRMILCRFEEVSRQDEFLEIDSEKLVFIMSRENHNICKQEILLESIVKWISHDVTARLNHLQTLLHCIELEMDEMYLRTTFEVQKRHLSGKNIHSFICRGLKNKLQKDTLSTKKITSTMHVIGGYYWHPLSEVHIWDPVINIWVQGRDMPDHTRESYSVSLLGPNIFVTGGYRTDNIEALDTVWIYNVDTDEWIEGCPMISARYYHCTVTLHGCVFAIGGYRGGAPAKEVEFYDPLLKKWSSLANMVQGVGNATACVLQDVIYVTGGHYGYRGSCTYDKIQSYRLDLNEWSVVTLSPHPEYGLCSVALNNKLYLVGGQTTIIDCYDPEKDEWRQKAPMRERRMECGAVVINGFIYVTGGYSYSKGTYLQSIEKYDPQQDQWEIVGNLPSAMRSHGCVCVYNV